MPLRWQLDDGSLMLFCVDGIDKESWYCNGPTRPAASTATCSTTTTCINEVVPLMRAACRDTTRSPSTGASFGGYHCTNFALRHPGRRRRHVSRCPAPSTSSKFLDGYYDENATSTAPWTFCRNMSDPWYLEEYRTTSEWVFGAGEHDICLGRNRRISGYLPRQGHPPLVRLLGSRRHARLAALAADGKKYFG